MYVGSVFLAITSITVAAMILRVAQTCVLIVKYEHPRYQMNPLKILYQNMYCVLRSDTVSLCFGFFGHF